MNTTVASDKLSSEWQKFIDENTFPERQPGELTVNEFKELTGLSRNSAQRILSAQVETGKMTVKKVRLDGHIWNVYFPKK